ncbi:MAG: hypothetical protein GY717_05705 [Rhodobacteraceae bacterium]|nr:hypothetical protein [Paracoccaceae bacterium]
MLRIVLRKRLRDLVSYSNLSQSRPLAKVLFYKGYERKSPMLFAPGFYPVAVQAVSSHPVCALNPCLSGIYREILKNKLISVHLVVNYPPVISILPWISLRELSGNFFTNIREFFSLNRETNPDNRDHIQS